MDEQSILNLVGALGFPIVVASYLLITLNKTIKEFTASNEAIKVVLTKVCLKLGVDDVNKSV